jgi:hypothetical protein
MGSWFPAIDSIAKERNGRASARPLCFRMSGQAVPDRQVVAQCLARASATHFLTALCWAHNDISLYLALFDFGTTSCGRLRYGCFIGFLLGAGHT